MHTSRVIAFIPALVDATGDHSSAAVLSQIMYWHDGRLRVQRRGEYWLAKSRAEMCQETNITLHQYKRILPLLVRKNLVTLERGLFANRVTPFIRLTDRGRTLMRDHFPWKNHPLAVPTANQLAASPSNQLASLPSNQLAAPSANLITESTTENTAESTQRALALRASFSSSCTYQREREEDQDHKDHKDLEKKRNIFPDELEEVSREGQPMKQTGKPATKQGSARRRVEEHRTAKEILTQHQKTSVPATASAPLETKGNIQTFWLKRIKQVCGGEIKPLTGKERGQLKMLHKYLGERIYEVIDYALNNWVKFGSIAGEGGWPMYPHVGFLLKHYPVAVNLLTKSQAPPPKPVEIHAGTVCKPTSSQPPEVPHELSLAEWGEIMTELDTLAKQYHPE